MKTNILRGYSGGGLPVESIRLEAKRHDVSLLALCYTLCVLCLVIPSVIGCSAKGQNTDVLFASANSQLASAQKAGAEQLAEPEFEEARISLIEAESAIENGDKRARTLIEKAHARARLAEAMAKQRRTENEAARLRVELEEASTEADRARLERQSAENELNEGISD